MDLSQYKVPTFCPVCKGLMVGKSTSSFYDFGCCINCKIYFVEGREQRWKDGWRPSAEDIDSMNISLGR